MVDESASIDAEMRFFFSQIVGGEKRPKGWETRWGKIIIRKEDHQEKRI
jgi:hypothetical protein